MHVKKGTIQSWLVHSVFVCFLPYPLSKSYMGCGWSVVRMDISPSHHIYISTYLHIYISTYLHIYITTYLHIYISTYYHTTILPYYHTTILPYHHIYTPSYHHIYINMILPAKPTPSTPRAYAEYLANLRKGSREGMLNNSLLDAAAGGSYLLCCVNGIETH